MDKKRKIIIISIVVIIALLVGCIGSYFGYFKPHNEAVNEYNIVVSKIQEENEQLDEEIKKLQDLVDNKDIPLNTNTVDVANAALKEAGVAKVDVGEMPKSTDDILNRAKELSSPIDYSNIIASLESAFTNLENSKKQYKQVTNPSEEFILKRILTIDDVVAAKAVTEDQDPNGQLNKAGGYTATVFFESKKVDQSKIYLSGQYTDILIDKGTDAGGGIEVYETVEYAEKRNNYLASFDGTAISSGSHTVIGTVVVRISDELTASQQKELEEKVIEALTSLE